jgi:hypothetical protein
MQSRLFSVTSKVFGLGSLALLMSLLSACSASIDSSGLGPGIFGKPDGRPLPSTVGTLRGSVDSKNWKVGNAIAQWQSGEYMILIAGEGIQLSCSNPFPAAPLVMFNVPNAIGSYPYDGSGGGRLVNVTFPGGVGGTTNVLAGKSQIDIDRISGGWISGRVAALSTEGESHTYSIGGSFNAVPCDGPATAPAFSVDRN